MEQKTNKPEQKFRAGAISATVWKNKQVKDGKDFAFHSVNIERRYKDKTGSWKSTNSFSITDLPKLKVVVDEAYKYVLFDSKNQNTPSMELSATMD